MATADSSRVTPPQGANIGTEEEIIEVVPLPLEAPIPASPVTPEKEREPVPV